MKKTVVIIFAVAILGAIGLSQNKKTITASPASSNLSAASSGVSAAASTSATNSAPSAATFRDGTYNGSAADTPYGMVQVSAIISSGKITNINFLQMPSDQGHSREITSYSEPYLKQTALDTQSAKNIQFVTGATSTSYGFQESLQAALNQAAAS